MLSYNDEVGFDFLQGTHYIKRNSHNSPRINPLIVEMPFGVVESYQHDFPMMYIKLSGLYAHFLIDGIAPILEVFEKDKKCLFLIDFTNDVMTTPFEELSYWIWAKEMFDKIGLNYKVITDSENSVIEVKNCHVKHHYQLKKKSIDILYKYVLQNNLNYQSEPTKKVYFSRKFMSNRTVNFIEKVDFSKLPYKDDVRVKDELVLENFLNDLGFQIVYPEEMTFEDQIKLMHETKILIGASQSGLINASFMKPKQTLIELSTVMIANGSTEYHDYWHSTAFAKMHNYVSIPHNRTAEDIIKNINNNKYLLELLGS